MKIFVCCHQVANTNFKAPLISLYIGSNRETSSDLMDNLGNNIVEKNPYYCELTGAYWIWKNVKVDYVGLFHYRRFFNFRNDFTKFYKLSNNFNEHWKITEENILKIFEQYDVIVPQKINVSPSYSSIYEHYAHCHYIKDLDLILDIIKRKYPDMFHYADVLLKNEDKMYTCNMWIAKKSLFDEYCAWLFDILFEAEKEIQPSIKTRSIYQQRVYGFLAERLFNVFIGYKQYAEHLRIKEVPILFWEKDFSQYQKYIRRYIKSKICSFFHISKGDKKVCQKQI